jgi:hypothetical protein
MMTDTLEVAIARIRSDWGPLSTQVVWDSRGHLSDLLKTSPAEDWLAALHREEPASQELYRDPEHGFVLLAHNEVAGLYRPPHDHGRGWVIYALQRGEIEMRTFARIETPDGNVQLVLRDSTRVRPGQVQVYLPGDIHDTRCVSGPALLFRFTERDLKREDKVERRVTRYVERDGAWTVEAP